MLNNDGPADAHWGGDGVEGDEILEGQNTDLRILI